MTTQRPERRARNVAWLGLAYAILLTIGFVVLNGWTGSTAVQGLMILAAQSMIIWFVLLLTYHQRVRVQDETFETEELKRERAATTGGQAIFDVEDEQLLLARRRLRWMYRWLLPVFSLLVVVNLATWAIWGGWEKPIWEVPEPDPTRAVGHQSMLAFFMAIATFLTFLFSRYITGMSRYAEWRMLRAGASYMMGITLASVALLCVLGAMHIFATQAPEIHLARALRILMLVLAAEFVMNFVLDLYRPRAVEEEPRPAFDSRVFGLFCEPGGIARSIAEAINYQFGFEVSSTWFYRLVQRSLIPLLGFGLLLLVFSSSFAFVESDEAAIVERFGEPLTGTDENGDLRVAVLSPGLHITYPWPIDKTYKVPVKEVRQLRVGEDPGAEKKADGPDGELLLWTNDHEQEAHIVVLVSTPELMSYLDGTSAPDDGSTTTAPAEAPVELKPAELIVTPIQEGSLSEGGKAVPVSLLRVSVTIQYKISDAHAWLTRYMNPQKLLESLAKRQIFQLCATQDVEGLLGPMRAEVEQELTRRIESEIVKLELPIELEFVGLQGVHPPKDTAESFQKVIGAESESRSAISVARAEYRKTLSEVAGDYKLAQDLAKAISRKNRLDSDPDAPEAEVREAQKALNDLVEGKDGRAGLGGKASEKLVRGRAERWEQENRAKARSAAFTQELITYQAAPDVYETRKQFESLVKALKKTRLYLTPPNAVPVYNLQDPLDIPYTQELEAKE